MIVLQLRAIPVKPAEDDELEEEAEWIFRHGFSTLTISMQVKRKNCSWASTLRSLDFTFSWHCDAVVNLPLFPVSLLTKQESTDYLDRGTTTNFSRKGPSTIAKIKEALNFMRNQHFEVNWHSELFKHYPLIFIFAFLWILCHCFADSIMRLSF